jgi:hypothetical protein
MKRKSALADLFKDYNLMITGLKARSTSVARYGIDDEFINGLEANCNTAISLNAEVQALKSRLKEKTVERDELINGTEKEYRKARKIVKLRFPQQSWVEFGILNEQ